MEKLKLSIKENEKVKIAMLQSQEKHNRRVQEMKEVRLFNTCQLHNNSWSV